MGTPSAETMTIPHESELAQLPQRSIIAIGWRAAARVASFARTYEHVSGLLETAQTFCMGELTQEAANGHLFAPEPDIQDPKLLRVAGYQAADKVRAAALFWASHPAKPDGSTLLVIRGALFAAKLSLERLNAPTDNFDREIVRDLRLLMARREPAFPFLGHKIDPTPNGHLRSLWTDGEHA
jgi:hypothetical protein